MKNIVDDNYLNVVKYNNYNNNNNNNNNNNFYYYKNVKKIREIINNIELKFKINKTIDYNDILLHNNSLKYIKEIYIKWNKIINKLIKY